MTFFLFLVIQYDAQVIYQYKLLIWENQVGWSINLVKYIICYGYTYVSHYAISGVNCLLLVSGTFCKFGAVTKTNASPLLIESIMHVSLVDGDTFSL